MFFAIGLLVSGLASASVGAYAGAMIMQGLLYRSIPMLVRRLVTLAPALLILALGFNPTAHIGAVAGRPVVRHSVRAASAGSTDQQPGADGNRRQSSRHDRCRLGGRRNDQPAQRGADLSDCERLALDER